MKISITSVVLPFFYSIGLSNALEGLFYQVYSDPNVQQTMQPGLTCVTAIFDETESNRGFFFFNGFDPKTKTVRKYQGELFPTTKNDDCFTMKTNRGREDVICMFTVDNNYLVVANGHRNATFVLSKTQPTPETPYLLYQDSFLLVNQTIASYQLPSNLIPTIHENCFFYPPRELQNLYQKKTKNLVRKKRKHQLRSHAL